MSESGQYAGHDSRQVSTDVEMTDHSVRSRPIPSNLQRQHRVLLHYGSSQSHSHRTYPLSPLTPGRVSPRASDPRRPRDQDLPRDPTSLRLRCLGSQIRALPLLLRYQGCIESSPGTLGGPQERPFRQWVRYPHKCGRCQAQMVD